MRWLAVLMALLALASCKNPCRESPHSLCATHGECKRDGKDCVAASDEDCRKSEVCRTYGSCFASGGKCVARDDKDCLASEFCGYEGLCTVGDNGACIARSDDSCHRSKRCAEVGTCTAKDGACVAANDEDCRRSQKCKTDGRCSLSGANDFSVWCKRAKSGIHTPSDTFALDGPGPRPCIDHCGVGGPEDCAQSEVCKTQGRCKPEHDNTLRLASHCGKGQPAPPAASAVSSR